MADVQQVYLQFCTIENISSIVEIILKQAFDKRIFHLVVKMIGVAA